VLDDEKGGSEIRDRFALRVGPEERDIPLARLQAAHDRAWRGVHHGLERNPDAAREFLAQIEPYPLRLVQRDTANDRRRRAEVERDAQLACRSQGLLLFPAGSG